MGFSEGTPVVMLGRGSGDSEEVTLEESLEEVRGACCVVVLSQQGAPWAGCVGRPGRKRVWRQDRAQTAGPLWAKPRRVGIGFECDGSCWKAFQGSDII